MDLFAHVRLLMAVPMEHNMLPIPHRWVVIRRVMGQKFAEQIGLARELFHAWVVGQQVPRVVTEDACATGFKDDDGRSRVELRSQRVEHL